MKKGFELRRGGSDQLRTDYSEGGGDAAAMISNSRLKVYTIADRSQYSYAARGEFA